MYVSFFNLRIFCLNACFTSDHQAFGVYSRSKHIKGAVIMTSIKYVEKKFLNSNGSRTRSYRIGVVFFNHSTKLMRFVQPAPFGQSQLGKHYLFKDIINNNISAWARDICPCSTNVKFDISSTRLSFYFFDICLLG